MAACAQSATQQVALGSVRRSSVSKHPSSFLSSRLSNSQSNAAEASQQLRYSTRCRKDTAPIVNASSQPLSWGVRKDGGLNRTAGLRIAAAGDGGVQYGGAGSYAGIESPEEESKRAMVAKRLEDTAKYFKRLGSLGFWLQLVCSVVSSVILAFSVVISGQATAPVTTYLTSGGIAAAFLSTFWSFGYMRLSNRLLSVLNNPKKAPPRASVVDNLKNGIIINLLGMGATLLGFLATVGVLVAKALTSSYQPFSPGSPAGYSPVLALDVFLIQASGNALLSHFFGLLFSLELLRAVTLQQPPPPDSAIPKAA